MQGDAGDEGWCRQLRNDLTKQEISLDFLVCNASPAIGNLGFALESVDRIRKFVDRSLAMTCVPLAGFHDWLEARSGRAVVISSAVASAGLHEYPPDWFHYVAAKYAVEGLVRAVAAQSKQFAISS